MAKSKKADSSPPETCPCTETISSSKIKVAENAASAVFSNKERLKYTRTQVDGCLIKNQQAADWVISKPTKGSVVVELKGVNIDHATKQVTTTTDYWIQSGRGERVAGLIIGRRYPKFDSTVQKAKDAYSQRFKSPLHIVCREREFNFEEIFSFAPLN